MKKKKTPHVSIELKPSKVVPGEVGVFAVRNLKKGQLIEIPESYGPGVTLTWKEINELDEEVQHKIKNFCFMTDDGVWSPLNFDRLPATWFLNHSCEFNAGFGENDYYVAVRDIRKGEELLTDFGLFISYSKFRLECKCKTASCRKIITGNDWKDPTFRKKNRKYMYSVLKSPLN